MKYYLGIDIGASSFKSGIIDDDNNIIIQNSIETNSKQTNAEALKNLSYLINIALEQYKIETIGVGVPCVVNNGKIIIAPNLSNWNNIDFGSYLKEKYCSIPIAIDNDANAAAFAELIAGKGKDLENFVYITLGTGVGGAIIINRQIYHGNIGGAGEIGHLIVDASKDNRNIPPYREGILELLIGKDAIEHRYKRLSHIHPKEDIKISVMDISHKAQSADIIACKTLNQVGKILGSGIASINHILDIGNFIIGGGISQAKIIVEVAQITAQRHSLPSVSKPNVMRANFLNNTGIIGAALLGKMQGKV